MSMIMCLQVKENAEYRNKYRKKERMQDRKENAKYDNLRMKKYISRK